MEIENPYNYNYKSYSFWCRLCDQIKKKKNKEQDTAVYVSVKQQYSSV